MKIAFINPTKHLSLTAKTGYYLLLTHLVLKDPEYANFWLNQPGYRILDNSLIELGESVSLDAVLEAAEKTQADEIVLPDVFLKKDATLIEVGKAISDLYKRNKIGEYRLQAVAQGATAEKWKECWDILSNITEIDCVAIPKVTETVFPGGRPEAVRYALANNSRNKDIHLLGCWSDISELRKYSSAEKGAIRGMDTSLIYHCTIEGQNFIEGQTRKPAYKINLEEDYSIDSDLLLKNQKYTTFIAR